MPLPNSIDRLNSDNTEAIVVTLSQCKQAPAKFNMQYGFPPYRTRKATSCEEKSICLYHEYDNFVM